MRSVDQGSSNNYTLCARSLGIIRTELCGRRLGWSSISQGDLIDLFMTPWHCAAKEIEIGATAGAPQKEPAILNASRDARSSAQALPQLAQHPCQSCSDQGPCGRTWGDGQTQSTIPAGPLFQQEAVRRRMEAGISPGKCLRERFSQRRPLAISGAEVQAVPVQFSRGVAGLSPQIHVVRCWSPSQHTVPHRSSTLRTRMVGARAGQLHGAKEIRAKHFGKQLHWTGQFWKRPSQLVIPGAHAEESGLLQLRARCTQHSRRLEQAPSSVGRAVENLLCQCVGAQEPSGRSALRFQLEPSRPQSAEFPCVSWPQHLTEKARMIREMCLKT